jgi:hypothetical protein
MKHQSAIEFLTTYGWAVLVIAVIVGLLFQLKVFSPSLPASCLSGAPFFCRSPVLIGSNLTVGIGELGSVMTVTGLNCSATGTTPVFTPIANVILQPEQVVNFSFTCPVTSTNVGTSFSGRLWIQYGAQNSIAQVGTVTVTSEQTGLPTTTAISTTSLSTTSSSTTSTTSTSTTSVATTVVYSLTLASSGGGTVTPSGGNYMPGNTVAIGAVPSAGYGFAGWVGTGTGNYTGASNASAVIMGSNIVETATFFVYNTVTFNSNTMWTVPANVYSVDLFLVGGGGGSSWSGGAGGYTKTYKSSASGYRDGGAVAVIPGQSWNVVIGTGGVGTTSGTASSFSLGGTSYSAPGATLSTSVDVHGISAGGSGGGGYCNTQSNCNGGNYGSNGIGSSTTVGGTGQGHTTNSFGDSSGTPYAGGAAGCSNSGAQDGTSGVGAGTATNSGTANTGGGAGCYGSGHGGSGVVLVRYVTSTAAPTYTLTMVSNVGGTLTPKTGNYVANTVVTINAIPSAGYRFGNWTGTGLGSYTGNSVSATVTVDSNITEMANFTSYQYATFTSNGVWTVPANVYSADLFLVGGGGGDSWSGGAGGYTKTYKSSASGYRDGLAAQVLPGQSWNVVIGTGGIGTTSGTASSFSLGGTSYSAPGATLSTSVDSHGISAGGSGGGGYCNGSSNCNGGNDGANGVSGYTTGGSGQGHTTRAFGEASGTLYAGGAAGCTSSGTQGGTSGAGAGVANSNGAANTGGGAGCYGSDRGGSGIVIVRYSIPTGIPVYALTMNAGAGGTVTPSSGNYQVTNTVSITATPNPGYTFIGWAGAGIGNYTGNSTTATVTMYSNVTENAIFSNYPNIYFTSNTMWTVPANVYSVDLFLVGGGSGSYYSGGAGGYTKTYKANTTGYRDGGAVPVIPGQSWNVVVGTGGVYTTSGTASSFSLGGTSYSAPGATLSTSVDNHGISAGGSGGGGYCNGSSNCNGGNDGANGVSGYTTGGSGQGHTTRAFGEATGTLYAGGAAGCTSSGAQGGTSGAGAGTEGTNGIANTGGGAGCYVTTDKGGSGIVILRYRVPVSDPVFTLTTNAVGGGTVSPSSGNYLAGNTVTITATPNTNYVLESWVGTGPGSYTGTAASNSIAIDGNVTETAYFASYSYANTVSGGAATLSASPTSGLPTYFCEGSSSNYAVSSVSWTPDVSTSLLSVGHQTPNTCTINLAGASVIGVLGVGQSVSPYLLRNTVITNGAAFTFNEVVGDSSQYSYLLIDGVEHLSSISLPSGCSTVSDSLGTTFGTQYLAFCYGQSPGNYVVSGSMSTSYTSGVIYADYSVN